MRNQKTHRSIVLLTCLLLLPVVVMGQLPARYAVEAEKLWSLIGTTYTNWKITERNPVGLPEPMTSEYQIRYVNRVANRSGDLPLYGSIIVTENYVLNDGRKELNSITIAHRVRKDYDIENNNWYWAHYSSDGKVIKTSKTSGPFDKGDFVTIEEDGRLWVFNINDRALADFVSKGELAKHIIRPGVGPRGMTIKSINNRTINEFLSIKEGFTTFTEDGRIWVFIRGSEELATFQEHGELTKCVVRPGAGPAGMTLKSSDAEVIERYLNTKDGFEIRMSDGRMWVFAAGDPAIEEYDSKGEIAKHVIRPGVGNNGMPLKSNDSKTITDYLIQKEGFAVEIEEERLWVFAEGSEAHQTFLKHGEPTKCVVFPAAGPMGMTVKGADADVLKAYLGAN